MFAVEESEFWWPHEPTRECPARPELSLIPVGLARYLLGRFLDPEQLSQEPVASTTKRGELLASVEYMSDERVSYLIITGTGKYFLPKCGKGECLQIILYSHELQ